jgi:hypothetical protein
MTRKTRACSIESYPGTGSTLITPVGSEGLPDGRGLHARLLHLLAQQVRGGAGLQYSEDLSNTGSMLIRIRTSGPLANRSGPDPAIFAIDQQDAHKK